MSKGIFTFFEEKQLPLCRYLALLSFNIHNFLFSLFWINCFTPFPISVIIFPLPFLHPLAFFAFEALFALIPHICFCRGSCEFIYFSWEIYSVHRCSLERLVCLFIVFKVQILKSFVSRMQSQIARKYCVCVFNGLPCPVVISFSPTHCKYPPTSFVWKFVCNYSKICAIFYWLPGGLAVFFVSFFQPLLLCDLAARLPPHLVHFWDLHYIIGLDSSTSPVPSLSGYPQCFLNGSHCLWQGSPTPFQLQPLPTPLYICLTSTFSCN